MKLRVIARSLAKIVAYLRNIKSKRITNHNKFLPAVD